MSVLRSHNNKTRGGLGRVCATGMHRPDALPVYGASDSECPFFQFLPREKNTRYNLRNTFLDMICK